MVWTISSSKFHSILNMEKYLVFLFPMEHGRQPRVDPFIFSIKSYLGRTSLSIHWRSSIGVWQYYNFIPILQENNTSSDDALFYLYPCNCSLIFLFSCQHSKLGNPSLGPYNILHDQLKNKILLCHLSLQDFCIDQNHSFM